MNTVACQLSCTAMKTILLSHFLSVTVLWLALNTSGRAEEPTIEIDSPMAPPAWALLALELLRANGDACEEFFKKYFDERGFSLCVERWGGDDGPDDAIETCNDWPLLFALGADEKVL